MRIMKIVLVLSCCLIFTGCTGIKNIQDVTYIVAIGMDYDVKKKEYTAYIQGLNFANVAKTEGGRPVEPIPTFVASATGETLNLAVSKLYKKSEPPLFFGHVKTLVLSQRLIQHKAKEVIEEVGRNRSLRPTLRVVTTEEDIQKVFNVKALFDYPAVYTVIFKKDGSDLAEDEIRPTTLMRFLRDYYEPMGAAKLPLVKIDKNSWKTKKNFPILFFNGYAVFQHKKFIKVLPFNDAVYINWLLENRVALDRKVLDNGKLVAAVRLTTPKMKIKYEKGTASPKFSIELFAHADLLEKIEDIPMKKLHELIEKDIKMNIEALYKKGVDDQIDVLNAGEKWYRAHPKQYQQLKKSKNFYLDKKSLSKVNVKVQVFHYNAYKYDLRGNGDF
ncbi:Ger(x)C family spore germination protein [Neobacillus citreus]|uniref:Ger(X)C family spore germination protein n=1 Tax=Neobacillus citreus TaxID=2833578 RepID=A0A942YA09_9BACI|nr:Ger(x)C family spore germination protein [Neobacillus citreus]MCH6268218.1 Ger(x)C family spore germination protein [Neobacillus citreus]